MERFQEAAAEGRRGRAGGAKGHGMVEMCGGSGEGMRRAGRLRDIVYRVAISTIRYPKKEIDPKE